MKRMFTLIELTVVIVILGVLAAITIPNVINIQNESRVVTVQSNLKNLQTSIDMYRLKNDGALPGVSTPSPLSPVPLDFDSLHPKYTRDLPNIRGMNYWVDYKGMVWASTIDSPTQVEHDGVGTLSWNHQDKAQKYNLYEVKNFTPVAGSAFKGVDYSLVKEMTSFSVNDTGRVEVSGLDDIVYAVSAIDENGFETAPSGVGYKGFEAYLSNASEGQEPPLAGCQSGGEGTEKSPYIICHEDDLDAVRNDLTLHYQLQEDIVLSKWQGESGWEPIGPVIGTQFSGVFDGNGHTISNLFIDKPTTNNIGLFRSLDGAIVKNLSLEGVNISGNSNVGSIAGSAHNSEIDNVNVSGTVKGNYWYVGGITGNLSKSTLKHARVNLQLYGNNSLGGLVGTVQPQSVIEASSSKGQITYYSDTSCSCTGAGGIAGTIDQAKISQSYSEMHILGTGPRSSRIGGIVGQSWGSTIIKDVYSTGSLQGVGSVGGIIGFHYTTYSGTPLLENAYSLSRQNTSGLKGGLVAEKFNTSYPKDPIVQNSYWDTRYIGTSVGGGSGKTVGEMSQRATYSDSWDFDTIWSIDDGRNFPKLRAFGEATP